MSPVLALRALLAYWLLAMATANFYVCEAGSPQFMGHYVQVLLA